MVIKKKWSTMGYSYLKKLTRRWIHLRGSLFSPLWASALVHLTMLDPQFDNKLISNQKITYLLTRLFLEICLNRFCCFLLGAFHFCSIIDMSNVEEGKRRKKFKKKQDWFRPVSSNKMLCHTTRNKCNEIIPNIYFFWMLY